MDRRLNAPRPTFSSIPPQPAQRQYRPIWCPDSDKAAVCLLHLFVGSVVVLTAIFADEILDEPRVWGPMQSILLVAGIGIVAFGFVRPYTGMMSSNSTNFCLSLLSVLVLLTISESIFRLIEFDFTGGEQAWHQIPPYYRQPISPTGEAFFKRPGSEQWTGQVLNTRLKQLGILPNPYANEPVITVEYDRRGFRNPAHMSDWEIAVVGDSFTELGYLAYEQLFASILARTLNVSVLNLGTSGTGPLAQLSYLHDYGIAASTKHTIVMFFEGNDLTDLAVEYEALVRWKETGQRDFREFKKQPSLVRYFNEAVRRVGHQLLHRSESDPVTAYFKSSEGDIPVTLKYAPPGRAQLSTETMDHLHYFFRQYGDYGKDHHITVWLAYLPSKLRVLYGQLEFSATANEELKNWQPTDLPKVISELCDQYQIKFIDLTPALIRETRRDKQLLYNSIYDTHLNSDGSLVVGQELASHFSGQNQ